MILSYSPRHSLPNNIYTLNAICGQNPSKSNPPCVEYNVKLSQYINYIGSLQELYQARDWDLPKYEYYQGIEGVFNNKKHFYTVKRTAGPYVSKGVGKNKKNAKKQAAKLLLKYWVNIL